MEVSAKEQRILQLLAGDRCAFPGCPRSLVQHVGPMRRPVVTGQIAHIISSSPDGPRGYEYLPSGEHDRHSNLIYLCPEHHKEIDDQPKLYTAERLRQMKADHETAVQQAIHHLYAAQHEGSPPLGSVQETIHSTLLPVVKMPKFIWAAPSQYKDTEEKIAAAQIVYDKTDVMCPFMIRDAGMLYAFNSLRDSRGPFQRLVNHGKAEATPIEEWAADEVNGPRLSTLLNRALNKLTGRRRLRLDRDHHRYFFQADEPGKTLAVEYRPLNLQSLVDRNVVWQPTRKRTGEARPFWYHLAARLRFLHAARQQWCLCIRPEIRVTTDGLHAIESKQAGSKITRQKSKMYNYDLLEEMNFWRDFLSEGRPRIVFNFGGDQKILVSTTLMSSNIEWPGMPEEFAKPFRNIEYDEDLFTLAQLAVDDVDEPTDYEDAEPDSPEE